MGEEGKGADVEIREGMYCSICSGGGGSGGCGYGYGYGYRIREGERGRQLPGALLSILLVT